MTIAGSDSGGGAGIQADLKTFAALGVYGTSVITAVTAQNTLGVRSFVALDPVIVHDQIGAVVDDIRPCAAKTGMLATAAIVRGVADTLSAIPDCPLVIDPVTHAKSGDALIAPDAILLLRDLLIPGCAVITPNLPEAAALTGMPVETDAQMEAAGRILLSMGAGAVVVKGGHREGNANDLYLDADRLEWLESERIATRCTHGTGCTFSAAITAGLARGLTTWDAVQQAKRYLTEALRAGYEVGQGYSPVDHFHAGIIAPVVSRERATA